MRFSSSLLIISYSKFKAKIALPLLLLVTCYLSLVTPANAQFPNPSSNYLNTNPDVPQNFHTYTQSVFIEIAAAVSCQLSGIDPVNPAAKCLGIDPKTQKIGFVEGGGGAIGMLGNLMSATFYIPVSTHDYGSYIASNFGIAKKTYAQNQAEGSLGFNSLQPTLKLWQAFRNLTYLIFVILFVIIGLGIMFRIRIDPRTVMTLQNQIPKIIIALVLVTFSYAIAGFLVDLMYVSIYLITTIFAEQGIDPTSTLASNPFAAVGGFGSIPLTGKDMGISGIAEGVAKSISGIVSSIFDGTLGNILAGMVTGIFGTMMGSVAGGAGGLLTKLGGSVGKFAGASPGWLQLIGAGIGFGVGFIGNELVGNKILGLFAGAIAYLVIIIAIFAALLKLWFQLIKAYIYVLINVVLAPFYIASGLIPGKSGFGTWIRSILANLSVFPVTIAMFLFGKAFMTGFTKGDPNNPPFIPPLTGDFLDPSRFASIIGLGIILLTPEVVNIVRDALKAPEFKYTSAIGRSAMVGPGMATTAGRAASLATGYELRPEAPGGAARVGFFKGVTRAMFGG